MAKSVTKGLNMTRIEDRAEALGRIEKRIKCTTPDAIGQTLNPDWKPTPPQEENKVEVVAASPQELIARQMRGEGLTLTEQRIVGEHHLDLGVAMAENEKNDWRDDNVRRT